MNWQYDNNTLCVYSMGYNICAQYAFLFHMHSSMRYLWSAFFVNTSAHPTTQSSIPLSIYRGSVEHSNTHNMATTYTEPRICLHTWASSDVSIMSILGNMTATYYLTWVVMYSCRPPQNTPTYFWPFICWIDLRKHKSIFTISPFSTLSKEHIIEIPLHERLGFVASIYSIHIALFSLEVDIRWTHGAYSAVWLVWHGSAWLTCSTPTYQACNPNALGCCRNWPRFCVRCRGWMRHHARVGSPVAPHNFHSTTII